MKVVFYIFCIFFSLIFSTNKAVAKENEIRIGLLKFGTVNWEIDIIKTNKLDEKNNINIKTKFFANKNSAATALQGNAVDMIVTDWVWVSRQRSENRKYVFYPHSMSIGGIIVPHDSEIINIDDLKEKRLGIAGSSIDKSWLLFRAYLKKRTGIDGKKFVKPIFAAPPLLNKLIVNNEVDAVLNYWHYKARLQSTGFRELISVEDILKNLGIETKIPSYGWVFNEKFAEENMLTINNFFNASKEAKKIMMISDTEWERIYPLTRAEDRTTLLYLRDTYRKGIPVKFSLQEIQETKKVFKILSDFGGRDLVGKSNELSPGTFWKQ